MAIETEIKLTTSPAVDRLVESLKIFGIKIEADWDGTDFLVDAFDKDNLRVFTLCFDKGQKLIEIWHGHYKSEYDELVDNDDKQESEENKKIADSVRLLANVFKNGGKDDQH